MNGVDKAFRAKRRIREPLSDTIGLLYSFQQQCAVRQSQIDPDPLNQIPAEVARLTRVKPAPFSRASSACFQGHDTTRQADKHKSILAIPTTVLAILSCYIIVFFFFYSGVLFLGP